MSREEELEKDESTTRLVDRGAFWAGIALAGFGLVFAVGTATNWWSSTQYIVPALLIVIGVLLIASRGRILSQVRELKALGTEIKLVRNKVGEQDRRIQHAEEKISSIQTANISVYANTSIAPGNHYPQMERQTLISNKDEINSPKNSRRSQTHKPTYYLDEGGDR